MDESLRVAKADAGALQKYLKNIKAADEAQTAGDALSQALNALGWSRGHVRDVIQQCLNETQKYHIGAPQDDPFANGDIIDVSSGGPPLQSLSKCQSAREPSAPSTLSRPTSAKARHQPG